MTITEDLINGFHKVDKVKKALQTIIDHQDEPSLNFAVNYAKYGRFANLNEDDLRTQCLYVLGNITRWRGPVAKEVRMILKAYCGVKR